MHVCSTILAYYTDIVQIKFVMKFSFCTILIAIILTQMHYYVIDNETNWDVDVLLHSVLYCSY